MLEKDVEKHLCKRTRAADGVAVKLVPAGVRGIPDRLLILPGGRHVYVELKRPPGKAGRGRVARLQTVWQDWLRERGHESRIVYTKEEADDVIREFCEDLLAAPPAEHG